MNLRTLERSEPPLEGALTYITFFQPACDWCRRQLAALDAHSEGCPASRAVAFGVWGSVGELRREIAHVTLPAFRADPALLTALDLQVEATPLTVLTGPDGAKLLELRGFADEARLAELSVAILGPQGCTASRR